LQGQGNRGIARRHTLGMLHKQILLVDAACPPSSRAGEADGRGGREIVQEGRFQPLLVVFFPAHNGESAIKLFEEEETTHLMGQGKPGKGEDLVGLIQEFL
jgi:hypothetical protein